jgi:hypothetical protein
MADHIAVFRRISGFSMPKLRNEDRMAVDLLLDRAVTGSAGNGHGNGTPAGGFATISGAVPQLGQVQALLRVLDMMPVEEPPADLLARTMRRVEAETAAHDPAALRAPQQAVDMHVPHA